ncbi:MAG: hypothetical protein FJ363_12270 [Gemmatimonadetes bacterium]|nr:hypothetical protein [Gemmatimonadota bacterium]
MVSLPFIGPWFARRRRERRAQAVVARLCAEPHEADVLWLSDAATSGDVDHARWELRYARRALGLIAAQRDALDDQTGSDVAAALAEAFAIDPHVSPERRELAERQFNDRVSTYREALQARGGLVGPSDKLGRMLLAFASDSARTAGSPLPRAIQLMEGYLAEAGLVLHEVYGGAPTLPEDRKPSEVMPPS